MVVLSFKLITSSYETSLPNLTKRLCVFTWMMRKFLGVIHIFSGFSSEETSFSSPRTLGI